MTHVGWKFIQTNFAIITALYALQMNENLAHLFSSCLDRNTYDICSFWSGGIVRVSQMFKEETIYYSLSRQTSNGVVLLCRSRPVIALLKQVD